MTLAVVKKDTEMVKLLVNLGASLTQPAGDGYSPLVRAILHNDPDMVRLLHQLGVDIHQIVGPANGQYTPMTKAIEMNKLQAIGALDELGADYTYALERLRRSFLAHVWGIAGTSYLKDHLGKQTAFQLIGLAGPYALRMLSRVVGEFFTAYQGNKISGNEKIEIQEAVARAFSLVDRAEILARVQSREPAIISGGSNNHSISMVLFKNQLAICNRGGGRRVPGIQVYELDSTRVTAGIIEQLTKIYPDVKAFNQMIVDSQFPTFKFFKQKDQKVGNCAWVSAKGAVLALFRLYINEKQGYELYKEFTSFAREKVLCNYLRESNELDLETLKKIKAKYMNNKPTIFFSDDVLKMLDDALEVIDEAGDNKDLNQNTISICSLM
jgi:hypothetical protein